MTSLPPVTCEPMLAPLNTWLKMDGNMPEMVWVWQDWLMEGIVTMLAGESGAGKSALALRIAMSVILGLPWPDGTPCAGGKKVLWCEAEAGQVINFHRAKDWGDADLLAGLVFPYDDFFTETRLDDTAHLARIEELASHPEIGLVVIDSLSGSHGRDENSVESALMVKALSDIAQRTRTPIILTHHVRKPGLGESPLIPMERIRGSSALVQHTRMVWALSKLGDDLPLHLRICKHNVGTAAEPIGVLITDVGVTFTDPPTEGCAESHTSSLEEAMDFLRERLGDGQRVPAKELYAEASENGLAERTLRRAGTTLGIKIKREDGKSHWSIPDHATGQGGGG